MKDSIYAVAFLLRKTGMTLTEVRELEPDQLKDLLDEISYQEAVVEYQTASFVANILAAIANTVPRKTNRSFKVADFLNIKKPQRSGEGVVLAGSKEELEALAAKYDIKLPAREIREL